MRYDLFTATVSTIHGKEIGPHGGADFTIAYAGKDIGDVTLHLNANGRIFVAGDSVNYWASTEVMRWKDDNFDDETWADVRDAIVDAASIAWAAR